MKNWTKSILAATAALTAASGAMAQTAAPAGAAPTTAAPAAPAAATTFSDAELKQFATAAIEINKIQADAAVTDKQPKMLAAVQASGLPPEKFNAIAQAAQADPALQQKIQAAAAPAAPAAPAN